MVYDPITKTYSGLDTFDVEVRDSHDGTSHQFISFDVNGHMIAATTPGGAPTFVVGTPMTTVTDMAPVANPNPVVANTLAPTIDLDAQSDSGVNTDNITNDKTPTITGHADIPFSQIDIFDGKTLVGSTYADANGDYKVTLTILSESTHTLSAMAVAPGSTSFAQSLGLDIVVDTTPPTLSIDAISTDNVINAAEHNAALSITGTTDAENGQKVTLQINGADYTGSVTNGTFSVSVPASAVGAFTDGQHLNITAGVTDQAGNAATPASANLDVDTTATLSIDAISTDDIVNAAEHKQALAITGTVSGVENGQHITVTLNGHNYDVAVSGGTWTTTAPAGDVKALATGTTDVTATVTDVTGYVANATHPITVIDAFAGRAATVAITDAGTDDIINATEKTHAVITGTIDPGSTLTTLTITDRDGKTADIVIDPKNVVVDAQGHYSLHNVDVSSLTDGQLNLTAVATDAANNKSTATDTVGLDTVVPHPPKVELTTDSGPSITDHYTNVGDLTVSGIEKGALVEYSVDGGKNWSQIFTAQEGTNDVQVRQTDIAGNVSGASTINFTLDTQVTARDDNDTIDEDAYPIVVGNVLRNDDHSHHEHIVTDASIHHHGTYGAYTLDEGGMYIYKLDNSNQAVDSLAPNETLTETIPYTIQDRLGNRSTANLIITIHGTNDAPVVSHNIVDTNIAEGADLHFQVPTDTFKDVDHSDTLILSATLKNGKPLPNWLHFDSTSQTFTGTPPDSSAGIVDVKVTATDSSGATASSNFAVDVIASHHDTSAGQPSISFESSGHDHVYETSELHKDGTLSATIALPSDARSGETITVNGVDHTITDAEFKAGNVLHDVRPGEQVTVTYTDEHHNVSTPVSATADIAAPTFAVPPTPTGSAGHQSMHGSLGVPPLIQQQTPTPLSGWGIMGKDGQVHQSLEGAYGTLHVNPQTGEVDYQYQQNSGIQKSGSSADHDVVDKFIITLAGDKNSQVEVDLHIHAQAVHGHSGHHVDATILTGMDVIPVDPSQHDEPQSDEHLVDQINIDLADTEGSTPHDASADPSATTAQESAPVLHFDLGNAAALLDDAKADRAAAVTAEALKNVAGLLEEHPDSVEDNLVKLVENAPVKEPVPSEYAAQLHSAETSTEDGAAQEPQADHADYVPPPSHEDDDDLHHDGTGLT